MNSAAFNIVFETVNGAWTILTAFFVVFLLVHFKMEWNWRGLGWRSWPHLPLGLRVAIALFVTSLGTVISRIGAWHWRHAGGHMPVSDLDAGLLLSGALIAAVGILCQIRVFTSPYLGHWPWIMSAVIVVAYVAAAFV